MTSGNPSHYFSAISHRSVNHGGPTPSHAPTPSASGAPPFTQTTMGQMMAQAFLGATKPLNPPPVPAAAAPLPPVADKDRLVTLRGIVMHIAPKFILQLRNQGAVPRPLCLKGSVHFVPLDRNDKKDLINLVYGKEIDIWTYIPLSDIKPFMLFDKLELRVSETRDSMVGRTVTIALVDPRPPCAVAGTPEFAESARAATLNLCGEVCPTPCDTCACPGKKKNQPRRLAES